MRLSPLQIIEETSNYYTSNPKRRAIIISQGVPTPVTKTVDGRVCSIARAFTIAGVKVFGKCNSPADAILEEAYNQFLDDPSLEDPQWLLKPQYRGWQPQFWYDLQRIHDEERFWDHNGITTQGLMFISKLKHKYRNEEEWVLKLK